jgi:hypothetical protein
MAKTIQVDYSNMKLGKLEAKHDPRTLQFANYLNPKTLPPIPKELAWGKSIKNWTMMHNDKIGDCTCAAAGHLIMEWTADNKKLFTPETSDIIHAYSKISGYDLKTHLNDNGANEIAVLNYWRADGIAGHKILAYAGMEPKNHVHIQAAIYLFGGSYIGLALPLSAKNQKVWSVPPGGPKGNAAPGSWGGHAVCVIGYDHCGLTVVTWGVLQQMTWSFWDAYCDESYAIISNDFASEKAAPNGFDLNQLQIDIKEVS